MLIEERSRAVLERRYHRFPQNTDYLYEGSIDQTNDIHLSSKRASYATCPNRVRTEIVMTLTVLIPFNHTKCIFISVSPPSNPSSAQVRTHRSRSRNNPSKQKQPQSTFIHPAANSPFSSALHHSPPPQSSLGHKSPWSAVSFVAQ